MAFDWFRRQFNQQKEEQTDEPPQSGDSAAAPTAATVEVQAGAPAAPAIAEDYLSFAKAAYLNIQKKQQEEAAATQAAIPE
ncbi:MAG TPA: hypothetical protein V6D18_08235, partial [Thermosynechococcaceae cyanobacterium]